MIHRSSHKQLLMEFSTWSHARGYKLQTRIELSTHLQELLHYIEHHHGLLVGASMSDYASYIQCRPNHRQGGSLSVSQISIHCWMIRLLLEYLEQAKGRSLSVKLPGLMRQMKRRNILSQGQIAKLYKWIAEDSKEAGLDRAMLAIYYSCGLRRKEGQNLLIGDIRLRQKAVRVRRGKGDKDRLVPLHEKSIKDLRDYVQAHRPKPKSTSALHLFISSRGHAMSYTPFGRRLKMWSKVLELNWPLTLHSLRHSIASHLLENGMGMELIQHFLGHRSLSSTELYTHLVGPQAHLVGPQAHLVGPQADSNE